MGVIYFKKYGLTYEMLRCQIEKSDVEESSEEFNFFIKILISKNNI